MKRTIQIATLIFSLLLPISNAEGSGAAKIPQPLVPLKGIRVEYYIELEKMRIAIKNNEAVYFYKAAERLNKILENAGIGVEETIVREWLFYYITIAPTCPRRKNGFLLAYAHWRAYGETLDVVFEDDTQMKIDTCGILIHRISIENCKKVSKRIGVDETKLRELHTAWIQEIFKTLHRILKESKEINDNVSKEEKEFWEMSAKEYRKIRISFNDYQAWELKDMDEKDGERYVPEIKRFDRWIFPNSSDSKRKRLIEDNLGPLVSRSGWKLGEILLKNLFEIYPDDGVRIQKIVREAGYYTDEKCATFLQEHIGRKTKYAYMYYGFPTERDLAEINAIKRINIYGAKSASQSAPSSIQKLQWKAFSEITNAKNAEEIQVLLDKYMEDYAELKGLLEVTGPYPNKYKNFLTIAKNKMTKLRNNKEVSLEEMKKLEQEYTEFQKEYEEARTWKQMQEAKCKFDLEIFYVQYQINYRIKEQERKLEILKEEEERKLKTKSTK